MTVQGSSTPLLRLLFLALSVHGSLAQPQQNVTYGDADHDGDTGMPPSTNPEDNPFFSIISSEYERCMSNGNIPIIDVHFHLAQWFTTAPPLLAEMNASLITAGLLMAVYGGTAVSPMDPNEEVAAIVGESQGRLYGLASLNTTRDDWDEGGSVVELERLSTYLAKPDFVGCKLAPPHTCLPLQSDIMRQIVETIDNATDSHSRNAYIHIGTTPFCGPMGDAILGYRGCCGSDYVDPTLLEDMITTYPNVTFILVHVGADFLPPDDEFYYNGTMADKSIEVAANHENVFLEISAFLRLDENQTEVYPGGRLILQKIHQAGLAEKTMYGSDQNHYPGAIAPYLATAITAMIEIGYSEEERCMILGETAMEVFGLDLSNITISDGSQGTGDDDDEGGGPPSASTSALTLDKENWRRVVAGIFGTFMMALG